MQVGVLVLALTSLACRHGGTHDMGHRASALDGLHRRCEVHGRCSEGQRCMTWGLGVIATCEIACSEHADCPAPTLCRG
jgi:hypothetical protein